MGRAFCLNRLSMPSKIKTAVAGATGYSGEELVRLLLAHPAVELTALTSRGRAGQSLAKAFPRLAGFPQSRHLSFVEPDPTSLRNSAEVIFLALPHGVAAEFAAPLVAAGRRVIDLSADFRLKDPKVYHDYYGHSHPGPGLLSQAVYGLPETHRAEIRNAQLIACPGCYPTSILLPILPLLKAGLIKSTGIIADSKSGVTGAGRKVAEEYLFAECHESLRPYAVTRHRHLGEIEQELSGAAGHPVIIQFTPHLIPMNRGILSTIYLPPAEHFAGLEKMHELEGEIGGCFQNAYGQEPFIRLMDQTELPDVKDVTGTNLVEIGWRIDPRTGRLIVMSALDNLLKGASGQAVQNFNILHGFPETTGLI